MSEYDPSPYARNWSESRTLPLPQELQPKYTPPITGKKLVAGLVATAMLTGAIIYGARQAEPQHIKDARAIASSIDNKVN